MTFKGFCNSLIVSVLSVFFLGMGGHLYAADLLFTASVDRTELSLSQTVTLTLQAEGSVTSIPDPKLPDLSDFRVLSGPNESTSFQFINGRISSSKSWTFVLKPKRAGTLRIGTAEISSGGETYRTEPITLEVSGKGSAPPTDKPSRGVTAPQPGKELPELFVQVSADKTRIYQNEQVILTYTIFTRVSVSAYEISRLPSTPGFWTEEFQLPQQPTVEDVVLSGRHYRRAVIRRVALFPTRSGQMVVDPLEVTCQVQLQDPYRRSLDPFDILFDSPFMRQRTEERVIETEPLTLNVVPLPAAGKPDNFSGAVGNFKLDVSLDRDRVTTNEALTMTVRFTGTGNIKLLDRPNFKAPSDFESYDPKESVDVKKSGNRISGTKTYEYVLIPRVPGVASIPPIEFTYFNPATKSYHTLKEGGFEVEVERGADESVATLPGIAKEDVKLLAEDIRYLKKPGRLLRISNPYSLPAAYWITMALPPVIAFLLWWGARVLGGTALQARRRDRRIYFRAKRELRALGKMAADGDKLPQAYGAIHKILLTYLGTKLGMPASGFKEEEVLGRLAKQKLDQDIISTLEEIFQACNYARFAPEGADSWRLKRTLKQSDRMLDKIEESWSSKR